MKKNKAFLFNCMDGNFTDFCNCQYIYNRQQTGH